MSKIVKLTIKKGASLEDRIKIINCDECIIDTIYTNTDNLVLILDKGLQDRHDLMIKDIEKIIGKFNYNQITY